MRKQVVEKALRSSQPVLGVSAGCWGEVPLGGGAFLPLDRALELESQEPITQNLSTLEVSSLPRTLKTPSTELSKLSRGLCTSEQVSVECYGTSARLPLVGTLKMYAVFFRGQNPGPEVNSV